MHGSSFPLAPFLQRLARLQPDNAKVELKVVITLLSNSIAAAVVVLDLWDLAVLGGTGFVGLGRVWGYWICGTWPF